MRRDESKRCGAQCARIGRGHIRNAQSALSAKYQVDSFAQFMVESVEKPPRKPMVSAV